MNYRFPVIPFGRMSFSCDFISAVYFCFLYEICDLLFALYDEDVKMCVYGSYFQC